MVSMPVPTPKTVPASPSSPVPAKSPVQGAGPPPREGLDEPAAPATPQESAGSGPGPEEPAEPFDPEKAVLREDWYKDPLVKKVLEAFNGDIIDVQKAKQ